MNYNCLVLAQVLIALLLLQAAPATKQRREEKPAKKPEAVDPTQPPIPLEQETRVVEYTLDPAKADKELEVGNFHMKRHNYAAAVLRFEEALKWNPKLAAAYLRLGEAREKRGESTKALEAYRKYLQMDPHTKKKAEVEKTIARLERELKE